MDLEAAIRKVTFSAAERFKLKDKGRIAPGLQADLCLLDPGKLKDHATFAQSNLLSSGVERLFLRGRDVTVRTV
jgi:N-acyl-D-aspartate/D-glutamate deacylase